MADDGKTADTPPKGTRGKLSLLIDAHPGIAILAVALLGAVISGGSVGLFRCACLEHVNGIICSAALKNPPWLLVSAMAAVPSVMLTWYWRTTHRMRELETARRTLEHEQAVLRHRTLELRRQEEQAMIERSHASDRADRDRLAANERASKDREATAEVVRDERLAKAVVLLSSEQIMQRVLGIQLLARIARADDHVRTTVQEVIAAWIRTRFPAPSSLEIAPVERREDLVGALSLLGGHELPAKESLDLSHTDLRDLILTDLAFRNAVLIDTTFADAFLIRIDFSGATLSGASLNRATLVGVTLDGATLAGADIDFFTWTEGSMKGATFDDETNWPSDFDPIAQGATRDDHDGK